MLKEFAAMASMLKQAQGMSGKVQEMRDRMANLRCEGQAGAGMVTVEVNGQSKLVRFAEDRSRSCINRATRRCWRIWSVRPPIRPARINEALTTLNGKCSRSPAGSIFRDCPMPFPDWGCDRDLTWPPSRTWNRRDDSASFRIYIE